jgi:hypothetical protein
VFLPDEPEATVEVRADPDPMPEDREVWSSRRRRSATASAASGGGFWFRDGDYIVGVNGKEFTDRRQMKALMTLASRGETVTFMVLRGGKTIELKIAGSLFQGERKEMGGSIERAARPR